MSTPDENQPDEVGNRAVSCLDAVGRRLAMNLLDQALERQSDAWRPEIGAMHT